MQHLLNRLLSQTQRGVLAIEATRADYQARDRATVPSAAGVAVIRVMGPLYARGGSDLFGSWGGMDQLRSRIAAAADDASVSSIVLEIDSPGGTVYGTPETAAAVRDAASKKKVVAVADSLMASAAYWIGSQASEIVVSPSADVGSIGVLAMHVDESKMLERYGLGVSLITSAKYKAEGNPFGPLEDEARAAIQADVDLWHGQFVRAVSEGRKVSKAVVQQSFGEGRLVTAAEAVKRGMADRIATTADVIAKLSGSKTTKRRSALSFI